jgi:hypothetical protein
MNSSKHPMPIISPSLIPELSQEWLHERDIVVFSITSVTRPVVDAYTELIKSTMATWPKN